MTFVSYSQNFEDVMLWRALKHVSQGFYIDLGAWSPDSDSVTRVFYEHGWSGVNVEPNPVFHQKLAERRPRDQNFQVAVGEKQGRLTMNFVSNSGLTTAVDAFARQHKQAGWDVERKEVELTTLATICEKAVKSGQDIHFLKVDVEGLEEAALRGNDWKKFRPWIVLVESTLPMTQIESYEAWEPILVGVGYVFAYADGLNRYYVADEHGELLPALKYPPNVFDDFRLHAHHQAEHLANERYVLLQQASDDIRQSQLREQSFHDRINVSEGQRVELIAQLNEALQVAQQAQKQVQEATIRAERAERLEAEIRLHLQQAQALIRDAEDKVEVIKAHEANAKAQLQIMQAKLNVVQNELHEIHQANHTHWLQLGHVRHELSDVRQKNSHHLWLAEERLKQLQSVLSSRSWRITAPLRKFRVFVPCLKHKVLKLKLKAILKALLMSCGEFLRKWPKLRMWIVNILRKAGMYERFKALHGSDAVFGGGGGVSIEAENFGGSESMLSQQKCEYKGLEVVGADETSVFDMRQSPRVALIYERLKAKTKNSGQGR